MELFDTHAHIDFPRYNKDRNKVIERARREGVKYILDCGADLESSQRAVELAEEFPDIYAAVGIHPHEASIYNIEIAKKLEKLAESKKVVAFGEIGLDYHYDNSPRDEQRQAFRAQLRLASSLDLPVIIHSREAEEDTLNILREEWDPENGGVVHCYSSSAEMAKELLDLDFHIGFTGLITFNNLEWLRRIVSNTPIRKILVETDSPYMSPEPYRGRRNEPARVKEVARQVAKCHNLTIEKVAEITTQNGLDLFKID
ncbi:MAG: TatD family hydrolase [Halanaerobiaceae bacterium]